MPDKRVWFILYSIKGHPLRGGEQSYGSASEICADNQTAENAFSLPFFCGEISNQEVQINNTFCCFF